MCGCAPDGAASSDGLETSSPQAGPAEAEPVASPEPLSDDVQALLGINEEIWEEKVRFKPFTQYYRDTDEAKQ